MRGPGPGARTFQIPLVAIRRRRKLAFVSFLSRALVCVAVVATVGMQAAGQDVRLQHKLDPALAEPPEETAITFWERFKVAFDRNLDDSFADKFHPLSVLSWGLKPAEAETDSEFFRDHSTCAARNALVGSTVNSAREAAVDLPLLWSLQERQGLIADFFRNSVGNVEEEAVAPLNPSYRQAEQSWWQGLSESGEVCYGIRPFRTNPYAFASLCVRDGDRLLLLGHVRYHYEHFANHCFELAMSVPLARGFAVDLGTSYQFGRHDEEKRLVVKLSKELTGGGIVHVGLELQDRPGLVAGITVPL